MWGATSSVVDVTRHCVSAFYFSVVSVAAFPLNAALPWPPILFVSGPAKWAIICLAVVVVVVVGSSISAESTSWRLRFVAVPNLQPDNFSLSIYRVDWVASTRFFFLFSFSFIRLVLLFLESGRSNSFEMGRVGQKRPMRSIIVGSIKTTAIRGTSAGRRNFPVTSAAAIRFAGFVTSKEWTVVVVFDD